MRSTLKAFAVGVVLMLLPTLSSHAQQQSLILGADTATQPDGGIMRRVQVDPQGRLVIAQPSTDGGTTISVPYCSTSRSAEAVAVGTTPTAVPADGGLSGRWMVRLCNSPRNSGLPIVTCTSDGTNPDAGLASRGESLEVGDCVTYTTSAPVLCVSDSASTYVTPWECK